MCFVTWMTSKQLSRLLPDAPAESTESTPALQTVMTDIISRILAMQAARFFRGEPDIALML